MAQHRKGFTLLELLMVVIIIAILVAIALPQFVKSTERARTAQMLPILGTIRGSELRYKATDGAYTTTLANLDVDLPLTADYPTGWDEPTVTVGTTSLVGTNRNSGTHSGADLQINIDNGKVCASTGAAAADWGVSSTC